MDRWTPYHWATREAPERYSVFLKWMNMIEDRWSAGENSDWIQGTLKLSWSCNLLSTRRPESFSSFRLEMWLAHQGVWEPLVRDVCLTTGAKAVAGKTSQTRRHIYGNDLGYFVTGSGVWLLNTQKPSQVGGKESLFWLLATKEIGEGALLSKGQFSTLTIRGQKLL